MEDLRADFRRKDYNVQQCVEQYEEALVDLRQKLKKVLKRKIGPWTPKSAPLDPEEKRQIINARRNELARARKAGLAPPPVPRAKRNSQRFVLEELTPENPPEGRTGVLKYGTTVPCQG